ncbi:hypothetical protein UAY_01985 [Enterococcus moraviensis ATCC BAA-383]|uniref:Uncharacterized protein n=1 Tax=Enterococcus moraviensis ATCC BAA-383 TaxID=1158609 RepID=R2QV25_9ENTE|nr:hypothetical protein [Enterococcus moraviensis]EOH99208.1 hypothetical protein UAY_01985 [Enterococcus moraviensis ATCC BAA-383]EOT72109.1 hypothetical protein I586_01917 [Enterococcus moraviensis ATCC BAA-383]
MTREEKKVQIVGSKTSICTFFIYEGKPNASTIVILSHLCHNNNRKQKENGMSLEK